MDKKHKDTPSWVKQTKDPIDKLATLVDFCLRLERYAKETKNDFVLEKVQDALAKIKGEHR